MKTYAQLFTGDCNTSDAYLRVGWRLLHFSNSCGGDQAIRRVPQTDSGLNPNDQS